MSLQLFGKIAISSPEQTIGFWFSPKNHHQRDHHHRDNHRLEVTTSY
jgi:hypothetical protein